MMEIEFTSEELETLMNLVGFAMHNNSYENAIDLGLGEPDTSEHMKIVWDLIMKLQLANGCGTCAGCGIASERE